MKGFSIFTVGLIVGLMLGLSALTIKEFGENFWKATQIYESSSQAKKKIESRNLKLPSDAYDLEYYYLGGRDYTSWIAFSAKNDDIEKIIPKLIGDREFEAGTKGVPNPPRYKIEDPSDVDWWPTSSKGFKTYNGDLFWIGHDTQSGRLYYYSFST
jgi:hypothetical protein